MKLRRFAGRALVGLAVLCFGGAAYAGAEMAIRRGGTLIAKGNDDRSGVALWCVKSPIGSNLVPYYFTTTKDASKDIKVFERMTPSNNIVVYTIRPNGTVVSGNNGSKVGTIDYVVGTAGTSYRATFTDASGKVQGYAYWSPTSAGFFSPANQLVGTFGSGTDGDMRTLAFFYFFIAPGTCP